MKLPRPSPRLALTAAALLLVGAVLFVAARSGPLAATRVTVAEVSEGTVAPALFGIGTVEARRAWMIGPTAAARVRSVAADVGESVRAGQLLAELEPVDLDARLASAQAAIARADSAAASAQAQLADARSRQALAAAEVQRYTDLQRQNFVSQSVVDAKLQQKQSADAQVAAAESALASARQDVSRLKAERTAVGDLRANLQLRAPADAIVTSREAEPGSTVVAGQAVLRLADPQSRWVRTRLDQSRSAGLRAGLPAEVVLRSRPGQALAAEVARVEPSSDAVTEERIAQVAFKPVPQGLTTGEMAEVTVRLAPVENALRVPNAAVHHRNGQAGVWRLRDGAVAFAPVKLGALGADGLQQILEGVARGDTVVVHSERALSEGLKPRVVEALAGAKR